MLLVRDVAADWSGGTRSASARRRRNRGTSAEPALGTDGLSRQRVGLGQERDRRAHPCAGRDPRGDPADAFPRLDVSRDDGGGVGAVGGGNAGAGGSDSTGSSRLSRAVRPFVRRRDGHEGKEKGNNTNASTLVNRDLFWFIGPSIFKCKSNR